MSRADLIRDELKRCGIEYVVLVPHTEARYLYSSILADNKLRLVQLCHEEETMGVYAGLYLCGKSAAIIIQNTGLLHSLDGLRGMVLDAQIPLLLLVGYRGYRAMMEGKGSIDSAAVYTEPILDALGIKHYLLNEDSDVENISRAYKEAVASNRPVAVLYAREVMA